LHVFGDAERYPPIANAAYPPPAVRLADLERLHANLGITRALVVQPTIYGTDHRLLLNVLHDRPQYRGVAIVNDSVSEEDLLHLHDNGIRAARFSLGGPLGGMALPVLERSVRRVQELGWQAKFGGTARDFIAHRDWLRELDCMAVFDHLAGLNPTDGLLDEAMSVLEELLRKGNWWILLANADRRSQIPPDFDDMLPIVSAIARMAPERAIWGTDWSHILYGNRALPNDEKLLAFLLRAVPDPTTLENILVHNPARLYGFSDGS
jgi:predicted TIM-barrel fold metal-dependent hydrolase